jgi:hypothetical protein
LAIEPSAGNGSFSKNIGCIAYDLVPEDTSIIQQDFLLLEKKDIPKVDKILFIGNPPFGERYSLINAFIKKCIELNASYIAFILPDSFNKSINQKVFPLNWNLILNKSLPKK